MRDFIRSSNEKIDSLISAFSARSDMSLEDEQKIRFFTLVTFLTIPFLISFLILNLREGTVARAVLILLAGSGQVLSLLALRRLKNPKVAFRINCSVLGVYFLFLMSVGGAHATRMLWMLIMPAYFFFLLGKGEGLVWTAAGFLASLCILVDHKGLFATYHYEVPVSARFLLTYGLIAAASYFGESTRERYAEQLLQVQTQRFQNLCAHAPLGMVIIGKDGDFGYANPKFKEMFGYDLSDVPSGREWFRKAYPDRAYRHETIAAWKEDLEGLAPGGTRSRVFEVTCKDGSRKTIHFRPVRLDTGEDLMTCEDISDRIRAEEALRKIEERLELALKGADLGLWDYDFKTGETFISERRAEMVGYSRDELGSDISSLGKLIHPDDLDRVSNALNAHLQGLTPLYECEHRLRHKYGQYVWILARGKVVERDKRGNPVRMAGTTLDITDRKRAEEGVRKGEEQYKTLVETMGESVVRIDENGMVKFVNSRFCEMSGYSRDEIIGRFLTDFPTQVDQEVIRQQMELRRQGIGGSYETVLRTKDGQEKHAIVSSRPIFEAGDVFKGTFIVGLDITERKRMEEALLENRQRLELALEGAELGLWDWNIQTGEMIFNKRGAEILGTSLDDLEPNFWSWSKRVHPDDRRRIREDSTAHLEGRTPYFETEYRLQCKSGEWIWNLSRGKVVERDKEGKPLRMVGISRDITEQKTADEALRESEERYRRVVDMSPIGIGIHLEGKIVLINDAGARIIGAASAEQLIGRSIMGFVHPDDHERVLQAIARIMQGEEHVTKLEIKFIHTDGTVGEAELYSCLIMYQGKLAIMVEGIDITDRKLAEEALRKSEERLELALKGADLGLWDYDLKTGEAFVNERRAEMVGYSADELGPHISSWGKLVHLDDIDRVTNDFNAHVEGRTPLYESEHRLHHKSGEYIWVLARAKVVEWDEQGHPVRLVGTSLDITDRKRAEEALQSARDELERRVEERTADLKAINEQLTKEIEDRKTAELVARQSEQRLSLALDGANLGVWDWDLTTGKAIWNERTHRMLGYEPHEVEADLKNWKKLVHPDDWPKVSENLNLHFEGKEPLFRIEFRMLNRSGVWLWIQGQGKVVEYGPAGKPTRMIGVLVDISQHRKAEEDLRESEERYRLLAENSLTGVLIHQDGVYVYVNARLAEITGYSVDELIGRDFLDIVHPDQRDQVRDITRKRYSGESIPQVYELCLLHKNGDTKWGHIMATTINYRGRDAIMGNLVDITHRKKSEEFVRQADRFRAVADLTSGIAHNFNNLLQIVIGNANLGVMNLQSGDLAEAKENLEQIEESARFGAETVNRLNRYARGSTDDQTAAIEVFDVCDLVAQAAEMSKPWWKTEPEKRGTRISLYTRLKNGCTIRGKKNEMFEVVVNLIRNSVEALPEGGDIEIETAVENNAVALRVRDTGIGIPRKNLNRLFTPFFTTSVQPARGLGLATCRRIVDAHGGTILVESVEGKGATFTITLPLVTEEPLPSEVAESKSPEKALTILAVDDLEATVRMLKAGLGRFGHKVFTALSGEEAVTMLKENPIDLVICDLGMPEMNGWQVGRAIKEICKERGTPRPAFIILTGWENPGHEKERISESGVDAVVQKPVDMTKLLEVIREVL